MKTPTLALLLLLIFSNSSYAQFRCGPYLVDKGDYKAEVLRKCGPPSSVERFFGSGGTQYYDFGEVPQYNPNDQGIIEEWVYDFGPRHLKQYLRFENGVLQETRNLSYGGEEKH